jgi:hypothetical protein
LMWPLQLCVNTTRLVCMSMTYSSPRAQPTAKVFPSGCHATLHSDGKVANRNVKVRHGATENGP